MTDLVRLLPAIGPAYKLERELGAGGMATVYLAQDTKHQRNVAVKVLRPELSASLGAERFHREIRVAAQLQHPHILPLLDSGAGEGVLYYVMPFVDGESLRDRLARHGELPVHDAVRILVQVADALAHAHAHGVVHRDIKPDNVMLSGRHALVTDFGVAKAVSESTGKHHLTSVGVALGTPSYMAPEQATADPNIDHRVDIYAVGAMAYELLTGRPPFTAASPQEILAAHVTATPEPVNSRRPTISQALNDVVMRCLEKRPADRWQSAEELLAQLEPLSTPSGGIAPTGARLAPLSTGRRLRWTFLAAGAFGALVIAVTAALWTLSRVGSATANPVAPVQLTANPLEHSVTGVAISPDGNYLAFVDPRGLHLQILSTKETRVLDVGVPVTPAHVSWFPDGTRLLFTGLESDGQYALWSISILGGRARRLHDNVLTAGVAPNGRGIALIRGLSASAQTFRELWLVGPEGQDSRVLARADSGESFWTLTWRPDSRAVAVGVWSTDGFTIELIPLDSAERRVLISDATLFQNWTGILPFAWCSDGRFVYSRRDGPGHQATSNVWIVATDVAKGATRGAPRRLTQWSGANVRDLSVNSACSRVVVLQVRNQADVFVGELDAGGRAFRDVRKQTLDERADYPEGWSPDGRKLLLTSARTGDMDIYLKELTTPADDLEPVYRAPRNQYSPVYAPSGEVILFLEGGDIWSVPATGGGARKLVDGSFASIQCPPRGSRTCVAGRVDGNQYVFSTFDPSSGDVREVARTARRIPFTNWSLSPDGQRVAVVHNDDNTVRIVSLAPGGERVIRVRGWSNFEFVAWTAAGDGLYVNAGSARASTYPALLRVDMDGRAHVLRRLPSEWHVRPHASPDGRFVAFASMSFHGNAWLIEGFR